MWSSTRGASLETDRAGPGHRAGTGMTTEPAALHARAAPTPTLACDWAGCRSSGFLSHDELLEHVRLAHMGDWTRDMAAATAFAGTHGAAFDLHGGHGLGATDLPDAVRRPDVLTLANAATAPPPVPLPPAAFSVPLPPMLRDWNVRPPQPLLAPMVLPSSVDIMLEPSLHGDLGTLPHPAWMHPGHSTIPSAFLSPLPATAMGPHASTAASASLLQAPASAQTVTVPHLPA
jgi:hypothetical protein